VLALQTLAQWRKENQMTQRDLARILGVTPGAVGNWESGKRIPRLPMLKKIARVFGCHIDDIDFGLDECATALA
jgi:transcriptional regulator with XRE-family HTH domain